MHVLNDYENGLSRLDDGRGAFTVNNQFKVSLYTRTFFECRRTEGDGIRCSSVLMHVLLIPVCYPRPLQQALQTTDLSALRLFSSDLGNNAAT